MTQMQLPYATAPVSEKGFATTGGTGYWGTAPDQLEQTPEMFWPKSVQVYAAMSRQDAQIASMLRAVTMPVRRMRCWLAPHGAADVVVSQLAEDLGIPVQGQDRPPVSTTRSRDRFSWKTHLFESLLCTRYGHSVFEQLYRYDESARIFRLRKLGYRPAQTIAQWEVADDGGLKGIWQTAPLGVAGDLGRGRFLEVERLVVYVLDREGGDWTGTSLLRPAYKNWLLKDRLLRAQAQTIERNGMGIPVYWGQQGASTEDLAKGETIATELRSGQNAGAAVPYGADLKLLGVEGTLPDAKSAIEYHDTQIARAVLAHFLTLGGMTGSWALGNTFADFFTLSLQALADLVLDTANQHIVEDWVDINYGPDEPVPLIVSEEIGSRHDATAQAIALLLQSGALNGDPALQQWIRQSFGLPVGDGNPAPGTETA